MDQRKPDDEVKTLLPELLRSVTRSAARRPLATLLAVAIVTLISITVSIRFLGFKTDRADLISPQARYHQRWLRYTEAFGSTSDIVVVVEDDDPNTIKQVLDELGTRMEQEPDHFRDVLFKVEPGNLRAKGLQYLNPRQLQEGLNRLRGMRRVTQGEWDLIALPSLFGQFQFQLEKLHGQSDESEHAARLLAHVALLSNSLNRFQNDRADFVSPWPGLVSIDPALREEANEVAYFLNDRGSLGFLKAIPVNDEDGFSGVSAALQRLDELSADVARRYPDVTIGVTGIPVLEHDEMHKSQSDMLLATVISSIGVGFVMLIGFRGYRHPLLALIMLVVGMAWAFGYTTLSVGHLNILSVSFAAILVGLGIDFAIHYLARYLELRHKGKTLRDALAETSAGVGTGIVTAAITTALAFFCATFTDFLGVAELGVIAGGGILLCALATFVVLPALVALADRRIEPRKLPTPFQGGALRTLTSRFPYPVAFVSVAVIGLLASKAIHFSEGRFDVDVDYDYNLLNLQAEGVDSVEVQRRVFNETDGSLLYAVSVADTAQQARERAREFTALASVHHVEELGSRMPVYPIEQIRLLVQGYASQLAHVPPTVPEIAAVDPSRLGGIIESVYDVLGSFDDPISRQAVASIDRFLDRFETLSLEQQIEFLDAYQGRMAASLHAQLLQLRAAANSNEVTLTGIPPNTLPDLPPALTSRFLSAEGKWLIQIFPAEQIWDIEPLSRFVADVRSVDPNVTGTPLQNYEASQDIMQSYQNAALYALTVIFVVLLFDSLGRDLAFKAALPPLLLVLPAVWAMWSGRIDLEPAKLAGVYIATMAVIAAAMDFRALRDVVLALLPSLAGGALMLGILAVLNIQFNPANLIVLPLVLGIGVDDGVHVMHDFRMQKHNYQTSPSTINAIVLTSLTSMVGFGSMMLAAHRGLYSLGLVLVVGVGSCLFVSLVTVPALLTLLSHSSRAAAREIRDREATSVARDAA